MYSQIMMHGQKNIKIRARNQQALSIVHITFLKKYQPVDGSVMSRNMLLRDLIENTF